LLKEKGCQYFETQCSYLTIREESKRSLYQTIESNLIEQFFPE